MSRIFLMGLLICSLIMPVEALDFTAPQVPEEAAELMDEQPETFADGLLSIIKQALPLIDPAFAESLKTCAVIAAVCLLLSLFSNLPGQSGDIVNLAASAALGALLLNASNSLIMLGADTVERISEYGKLLLPVLTAALTAQGGVTTSTAVYAGTAFFDAILSTAVSKLIVPMIYLFLCLAICEAALGTELLEKMKDLVKWLMTWVLKLILYIFTGYIGITGVVSGSTDAAALKAAKLTISGVVPVVGGILSDASEAVLVGAGAVKNAAGIYGMLAILALWISPFIQIGVQYLLVKATAGFSAMFVPKPISRLVSDFSTALGMLVAMTGTVCLMMLVSIVCFMRGVG